MPNKSPIPPKLAHNFLLLFLRESLVEEVEGDLGEQFYQQLKKRSAFMAKMNYWFQVFNYFRPFAIKNIKSFNSNQYDMFQNYFKIGYRNLFKNKGFATINIGGLALGMSVALLIGLWIHDELSFNKYHHNYERIAQVMRQDIWRGELHNETAQVRALGPLLKSEYGGQFKDVVRVRARLEEHVIAIKENKFTQTGYYMDPGGPAMFSLHMVKGSWQCLADKNSIILSESLARKLFGETDPMHQVVKMDAEHDLKVTGVYEDLPLNTEFSEASYFAPVEKYLEDYTSDDEWTNQHMYIYVQLNENTDLVEASALIKNAMTPHISINPNREAPLLILHPMKKWHLYSEFENGKNVTSNSLKFVWFYGIIGVFVLFLACINFMNLSTARSEKRSKEVGIRKTMGSLQRQLVFQFLSESFLVVLLAFLVSLLLVNLILPGFNVISGKNLSMPWSQFWFWIGSLVFLLTTSLLAGSYPSIYLSSLKPVKVLKGKATMNGNGGMARKVLVVFQFTISIVLIVGTMIVNQQIQYVKDRPVGYSKKGLLMFRPRSPEYFGKYQALRNELLQTGVVTEMGEANYPLTTTLGNNNGFNWQGKDPDFNPSFNTIYITHEYGRTIGWEFTEGRDFSRDMPSDISGIIITESTQDIMGLENPVGETVEWRRGRNESNHYQILGVVKDMIKQSPYESARPAIMFLSENDLSWLFLRINPDVSASEAIPKIQAAFHNIVPSAPFDYKFVDELYDNKFRAEERIGTLATFLASLAIVISCLGLIGLTAYMAEQRTKEIGIRKVLGASVIRIWQMLTRENVILVAISCLLASPMAYYLLHSWLLKYEYHMEIKWWIFLVSGAGALVIALIMVSIQAIKSATANPVDSLRLE